MEQDTATIDPITGESTEKTETASTVTAPVEGQASQEEKETAGEPKGESEGGKDEGTETRKPFRSKNQTIYELRQKLREQEGTFSQKLSDLEKRLEEMSRATTRGQDRKPSRTFWEAPEEVLEEKIKGHLSEFEKRILENMNQTRKQDQQSTAWQQETSEAAKFITSQKGMTEDDIHDIEEIVRSTPAMQAMSPMQRAEYALYLWQKERGIGDRTALKQRAATVVGAPPGQGPKELTEAEIQKRLDEFPANVADWTPEDHQKWKALESEIRKTQKAKA